ncbi:hypothetical protein GCM10023093_01510 [Nemorincola caseinilytica]|uniref:DUF6922 domain-containing protein n=1 Tax=Nemorincola caseinilytica TaxID=2054315 RepID=A0ABP8N592_9BACT
MNLNRYKEHPDARIDPGLLWEYDLTAFDYQKMRQVVVQRVVERGFPDDWYAALDLYGKEGMAEIIRTLPYLNDKDMNFVSVYFDIPLSEMKCYELKRSRQAHWNS